MSAVIDFLLQNFILVLVVLVILLITTIGFLADLKRKKKLREKVNSEQNVMPTQDQNMNNSNNQNMNPYDQNMNMDLMGQNMGMNQMPNDMSPNMAVNMAIENQMNAMPDMGQNLNGFGGMDNGMQMANPIQPNDNFFTPPLEQNQVMPQAPVQEPTMMNPNMAPTDEFNNMPSYGPQMNQVVENPMPSNPVNNMNAGIQNTNPMPGNINPMEQNMSMPNQNGMNMPGPQMNPVGLNPMPSNPVNNMNAGIQSANPMPGNMNPMQPNMQVPNQNGMNIPSAPANQAGPIQMPNNNWNQ